MTEALRPLAEALPPGVVLMLGALLVPLLRGALRQAAMLAPCMVLGEPLKIDASVSPKLLSAVPRIQTIYRCWDDRLFPVDVVAGKREVAQTQSRAGGNTGLFFSVFKQPFQHN